MLKRRKRYTQAEVDAIVERAVRDTGDRFARIMQRAAAATLDTPDLKALIEAWDWECHQSVARKRADDPDAFAFEA